MHDTVLLAQSTPISKATEGFQIIGMIMWTFLIILNGFEQVFRHEGKCTQVCLSVTKMRGEVALTDFLASDTFPFLLNFSARIPIFKDPKTKRVFDERLKPEERVSIRYSQHRILMCWTDV
jgi:hypothetical protein